jgi:glycosyltransferase involved in cell wall biosynthesis
MGQRPLISVIIPTYNRAESLKKSISSVLSQTFPDLELIVVDDGSTDCTEDFIGSVKDKRLLYFYQANCGVSNARNLGIEKSGGEWIAFLDSDDIWFSEKLEKQLEQTQKDKLMWCHTEEIWIRRGKRVNPKKKHEKPRGRIYLESLPLCAVSPSTVMIHKSVLRETGLFDPLLPVAEDYDLWLRIASRYPISFCETPLIEKYGGHADQLSASFLGMDRFRLRALRKQINSPHLSREEKHATLETALRKCEILILGYEKHGKNVVADYYKSVMKTLTPQRRLYEKDSCSSG